MLLRFRLTWICLLAMVVAATGCGAPEAEFKLNTAYVRAKALESNADLKNPRVKARMGEMADILASMFGTPDHPQLPPAIQNPYDESAPIIDLAEHMNMEKLVAAGGAVGSDEAGRAVGLYREHCAHCHGITGDGMGPTAAFLNPYPRDYRMGVFKFKSTPADSPPTDADLHRVLYEGVAGTAMPSFKLLTEDEREALVQYVKFLSVRGMIERTMVMQLTTLTDVFAGALDPESDEYRILDLAARKSDPEMFQEQLDLIQETAYMVSARWLETDGQSTDVPPPPADWETADSISRGKALFYTELAACAKCHGQSGLGDGQVNDYDDWTKELVEPKEQLPDMLALGVLPPRNILPRNLRQGIYRGGRRPIDMYWRVKNGIKGSPMPAASQDLSDDQVWDIVAYVRSLPYESISQPGQRASLQRDRM